MFTADLRNMSGVKIHTSMVAKHVTPQSRKPRGPAPSLERGHAVTRPSLLTPPALHPITCGWVCRISVWHMDPDRSPASNISHTCPAPSCKVQNTTPPVSGHPLISVCTWSHNSKPTSTLPHLPRHFGFGHAPPVPSAPMGHAPIPSAPGGGAPPPVPSAPTGRAPVPTLALTLFCMSEAHQEAEGGGPRDRHTEMWGVIKGPF